MEKQPLKKMKHEEEKINEPFTRVPYDAFDNFLKIHSGRSQTLIEILRVYILQARKHYDVVNDRM